MEYNSNRLSELESIIKDIKQQKKTEYDEKISQIKELKCEIDNKSSELVKLERIILGKDNRINELEGKLREFKGNSEEFNSTNNNLVKENKENNLYNELTIKKVIFV